MKRALALLLLVCGGWPMLAAMPGPPPRVFQRGGVEDFDVVILNGRVIDPESGLDALRSVGIRGGTIAAIESGALRGKTVIDATGHVVAPGFVDLHRHGQNDEN